MCQRTERSKFCMLAKVQKVTFLKWIFHVTCCVQLLQDQTEKLQNYQILTGFLTLPHTHTERVKQSTKLILSSEMAPQCLTELLDVFERRTPSITNDVSDFLWCSLQSAPLCFRNKGGNAERKIVDLRSGDTSYREIWLAENEKLDGKIIQAPPT